MKSRSKNKVVLFLAGFLHRNASGQRPLSSEPESPDVAEDRMIRNHFRTLPNYKCPKNVTHEVLRMTVKQEKRSLRDLLDLPIPWKIGAGLVGAATIAVLAVLLDPQSGVMHPRVRDTVTEAEVQRAREQLKWSLAYTSQLINQSEKKAIHEAVMDELPKTLRNTLERAVPIFKGGES